MFIKPPNSSEPFTYDRPSKDDYLQLIGADAFKFCHISRPRQCKQLDPKDLELQKRCQQEFNKCLEKALSFEFWHRTN